MAWKGLGVEPRLQARIVNYADDLVICCRKEAQAALQALKQIVEGLQLSLNEEKTQIRRVPGESFDFLGYTLGGCYSRQTGKPYLGTRPSKKRIGLLDVLLWGPRSQALSDRRLHRLVTQTCEKCRLDRFGDRLPPTDDRHIGQAGELGQLTHQWFEVINKRLSHEHS